MACKKDCCVLTRGEFFMADFDGSCNGLSEITCQTGCAPFKKVGNVLACNVEITSEIFGRENEFLTSEACPRSSIIGVNFSLTMGCASARNLIQALYGKLADIESGTKEDSYCVDSLDECDFFPFSKKQATLETVIVRLLDEDNDLVKTLVLNTDYKLSKSGVEIVNPEIDIENASLLEVSYSFNNINFKEITFGQEKPGYKSVYFKGVNYANNGSALFDARFNKVLFKAVDVLSLLSADEFMTITLQGVVDKVNGSWFSITKQEE